MTYFRVETTELSAVAASVQAAAAETQAAGGHPALGSAAGSGRVADAHAAYLLVLRQLIDAVAVDLNELGEAVRQAAVVYATTDANIGAASQAAQAGLAQGGRGHR